MQEFGSGEIGDSVSASPYVFDTALLAAGAVMGTARVVLEGTCEGGFAWFARPVTMQTPWRQQVSVSSIIYLSLLNISSQREI